MDTELFKAFRLLNKILKASGIWQDGNQSWKYFIIGHLFRFIIVEYNLVILSIALETDKFEDFMKGLLFIASQTVLLIKCWNFLIKIRDIQKCFRNLLELLNFSADDRFKTRSQIKKHVADGYKIYKIFWISAWLSCFLMVSEALATHKLAYNVRMPFDTKTSEIGFWITSAYLAVSTFTLSAMDISLDIMPVIFLTFAIGLIDELSARLQDIEETENKEEEIVKCMEIHKKIKLFVDEIRDNFAIAIFIQGFLSSFILCVCVLVIAQVSST